MDGSGALLFQTPPPRRDRAASARQEKERGAGKQYLDEAVAQSPE